MLGNTIAASRGHAFRVLVSTSSRILILRVDRHGLVDDWQSFPHGVVGGFAKPQVVILVGSWYFQRVKRDVTPIWYFLDG